MKRCCFFLVLVLLTAGAVAAPEAELGPRETRMAAARCLMTGDYASAIPLLQQLIQWFADAKNKNLALETEATYFHLALCHFLLGHFPEASPAFEDYLKKYPRGSHSTEAAVYLGDCARFALDYPKALKAYQNAIATCSLDNDWSTDVNCSMARCALAKDDWKAAIPLLRKVYDQAPDDQRANWAATLLTVAYLKERQLSKIYELVPGLLRPNSFASRSAAFNLAALEAGDDLFAGDQYRDALWIYRLVFPKELIISRAKQQVERLQKLVEVLRQSSEPRYRELMRTEEYIGELEEELKAMDGLADYSTQLQFRVGRAYLETRRVWEARAIFLDLHEQADGDTAEECLFLAFQCAVQIQPWDDAFKAADAYRKKYPQGKFVDQVTLTIGHMHAMRRDWPTVIRYLTDVLKDRPKHESIAECMFLIGYAYFQEENYANAATWLNRLNTEYPQNDRREEVCYWLGMAQLFNKGYDAALKEFTAFLRDYPKAVYREDATFRHAVCRYGLGDFKGAEQELAAFAPAFPRSKLVGEAWMMLADISGFFGDSPKAVSRYKEALKFELNIELYNYCTFRATEMLYDMKDFRAILAHLKPYMAQNREDSNIPLAVYWTGRALWEMEQREEALNTYRDSLKKYGSDRKALGIDLILDEWIGHAKKMEPDVQAAAWKGMTAMLAEAEAANETALALRLRRGFLFRVGITPEEKEKLLAQLVCEASLAAAPAVVLELIMDEAPKRGDIPLAVKAAEGIVRDFAETEYGLSARMFLARQAAARKDYPVAEEHLNIIRQLFAADPVAADALLLLGNVYLEQQRYDEADKCFENILAVREWRGPVWPAALYGRGECARQRRQFDKAAAYYERIYVMYSRYRDWTGKGYLRRAECLERLQQPDKAKEVLQEMLATVDLRDSEAGKQAQQALTHLEKQ